MDQVEVKLNLIIDGMKKKEAALREAAGITENQSTVLDSALSKDEILAFIVTMNREKQQHIQTVINCDHLFERILKEIGPSLDANPDLYKPQIGEIQKMIRQVMDLDVAIRVQEEKNSDKMLKLNRTIRAGDPPVAKQSPAITDEKRVIKAYEENSKNYKG
ncbi:MAG: hypothetical protein LBR83_05640 [Clostridiales bacterium]|nr:hypothetical protein [Clostridiales bacterium]